MSNVTNISSPGFASKPVFVRSSSNADIELGQISNDVVIPPRKTAALDRLDLLRNISSLFDTSTDKAIEEAKNLGIHVQNEQEFTQFLNQAISAAALDERDGLKPTRSVELQGFDKSQLLSAPNLHAVPLKNSSYLLGLKSKINQQALLFELFNVLEAANGNSELDILRDLEGTVIEATHNSGKGKVYLKFFSEGADFYAKQTIKMDDGREVSKTFNALNGQRVHFN